MSALIIIGIITAIVIVFVILCCCKAAGDADRSIDKLFAAPIGSYIKHCGTDPRRQKSNEAGGKIMKSKKVPVTDGSIKCDWCHVVAHKPPIGIMPRYIHEEIRRTELAKAISRYLDDGRQINPKWVEEYNELVNKEEKSETFKRSNYRL